MAKYLQLVNAQNKHREECNKTKKKGVGISIGLLEQLAKVLDALAILNLQDVHARLDLFGPGLAGELCVAGNEFGVVDLYVRQLLPDGLDLLEDSPPELVLRRQPAPFPTIFLGITLAIFLLLVVVMVVMFIGPFERRRKKKCV